MNIMNKKKLINIDNIKKNGFQPYNLNIYVRSSRKKLIDVYDIYLKFISELRKENDYNEIIDINKIENILKAYKLKFIFLEEELKNNNCCGGKAVGILINKLHILNNLDKYKETHCFYID